MQAVCHESNDIPDEQGIRLNCWLRQEQWIQQFSHKALFLLGSF